MATSRLKLNLAACAFEVRAASREIQLMPAGPFRGVDGRPADAPHWQLDEQAAASWLADLRQRQTKLSIDYEHQTLRSKENGKPAPAAAWFSGAGLEIRDGALWATDVEWTAAAKNAIEAGEYLYISPVFFYDKSGTVTGLFNAALTNAPSIDGMEPVLRAAASQIAHPQEDHVDKEIRKALGLAEDAKDDDVLAACKQVVSERAELKDGTADLENKLAAANQQIEAEGGDPDPSKFVPVEVVNDLRDQVAALSQTVTGDKVAALVDAALEDGRLVPAMKDWATNLGKKDFAALTQYLEKAEPIAGLRGDQSGGEAPRTKNEHGLTEGQMAICNQLGQDPAEYAKQLKDTEETQAC
jgi:phage I-like protein